MDYEYPTETFQSFIEDVATAAAKKHDARLEHDALEEVVSVANRALRTSDERNLLETRRDEIQRSVEGFVTFIATDFPGYDRSGVISYRTLHDGRARFCQLYPDAYPICPYP